MTELKKVEFGNPPVNEVVFGLRFDSKDFSPVHYGSYWESIKARFPNVSQQLPIWTQEAGESPAVTELPLPRVWFESDDRELLQLQADRFHYNWRKQFIPIYPSFKVLLPKFLKEYELFEAWAKTAFPKFVVQPKFLELTYINHIGSESGWNSAPDTASFLLPIELQEMSKTLVLKAYATNLEFDSTDKQGTVSVAVREVVLKSDAAIRLLQVDLTVRKKFDEDDFSNWFKAAHNKIIDAFVSLITDNARKVWRMK